MNKSEQVSSVGDQMSVPGGGGATRVGKVPGLMPGGNGPGVYSKVQGIIGNGHMISPPPRHHG